MIQTTRPVAASRKCARISGGRILIPASRCCCMPPLDNQIDSRKKPPPAVAIHAISAAHSISPPPFDRCILPADAGVQTERDLSAHFNGGGGLGPPEPQLRGKRQPNEGHTGGAIRSNGWRDPPARVNGGGGRGPPEPQLRGKRVNPTRGHTGETGFPRERYPVQRLVI